MHCPRSSCPAPGPLGTVQLPVCAPSRARCRLSRWQWGLSEVVSARKATPTGMLPFVTRGVRCRHHWPPATFPQCPLCEASPADSLSRARCSSSSISARLSGASLCLCLRDDGAPALPGGLVSRVPAPRHVPGGGPPPALASPAEWARSEGAQVCRAPGDGLHCPARLSPSRPGASSSSAFSSPIVAVSQPQTQLGSSGGSPGGLVWAEGLAT